MPVKKTAELGIEGKLPNKWMRFIMADDVNSPLFPIALDVFFITLDVCSPGCAETAAIFAIRNQFEKF